MEANNKILIIGPPASGKTAFFAQFDARLENKTGVVKAIGTAKNISAIVKTRERYEDGEEPEATPSTENSTIEYPLKVDDEEIVLRYHDYGGEQVRDITKLLQYDKTWSNRAKEHDRWVLFIRLSQINHFYDLSRSGFAKMSKVKKETLQNEPSDQFHFIELLQVLLHARGQGVRNKMDSPRLLIALTCWDELPTENSPSQELQKTMPLLHEFIGANWVEHRFKVVGVSAQGFPLDSEERKDKFRSEGPESFGYLVLDDNPKEGDLTMLIKEAMDL